MVKKKNGSDAKAHVITDKEIRQKVSEGSIHIRAIVEIVGKPSDFVKESMDAHLKKIKADESITVIKEEIEKPVPQDNYFSSFAEIELLVKDISILLGFCFDYLPSSVEILSPAELVMKNNDVSDFLNDLQTRLLSLNTRILQMEDSSKFYIKNTAVLLQNFAIYLLSQKPRELSDMTLYMGVREEDIEKVVQVLMNQGKVVKEGSFYKAIPKKD